VNGVKFNRPVTAAVYALGMLMIVIPFTEVLLSVLPLRPGATSWRFGTTGVLSQAFMTPLLGATVIVVVAATLGHRRTLLTVSIVSALVAVITLAATGLFALDIIEMRSQVREEVKRAFDFSSILAVIKLIVATVVLSLLSSGARRTTRELRSSPRSRSASPPLVVSGDR